MGGGGLILLSYLLPSAARPIIMTYGLRISGSVYICMQMLVMLLALGGKPVCLSTRKILFL